MEWNFRSFSPDLCQWRHLLHGVYPCLWSFLSRCLAGLFGKTDLFEPMHVWVWMRNGQTLRRRQQPVHHSQFLSLLFPRNPQRFLWWRCSHWRMHDLVRLSLSSKFRLTYKRWIFCVSECSSGTWKCSMESFCNRTCPANKVFKEDVVPCLPTCETHFSRTAFECPFG